MNTILNKKSAAYLCALLCVGLWGTAFPLIKLGYGELGIADSAASKLMFAGERFALAGVIVFVIGSISVRRALIPEKKSDILPIVALGFVQTFLQYLFAYIGVGATTATNTSIITGTVSLISVLMAAVFFKSDRLTVLKIIGCAVGFIGIAVVNMGGFSLIGDLLFGNFIVLLSAFAGASGNIITKKVTSGRNAAVITAWQLFFGGVLLFLIGLVLGGSADITKGSGAVILLWLAIVSSVSFLLWTELLGRHPVSRISVFTMLVPIFGTLWSGILLGEEIFRVENLIALALICAGILLVNLKSK